MPYQLRKNLLEKNDFSDGRLFNLLADKKLGIEVSIAGHERPIRAIPTKWLLYVYQTYPHELAATKGIGTKRLERIRILLESQILQKGIRPMRSVPQDIYYWGSNQ